MLPVTRIFLIFIPITFCTVLATENDEEGLNLGLGFDEQHVEFEHNHAESSCKWTDPPDDGYNYRLCNTGICAGEKGSYSKNGTLRFTKCKKHFVLAEGFDRDTCKNGVWSSSGHKCIQCGKSPRDFNPSQTLTLIHAGRNSSRGDFPWMAGLYAAFDEGMWRQICGGTLISPTLVLTAAHCLEIDGVQFKPQDLKIGLGKLLVDYYAKEEGSEMVPVKEIIRPERYSGINHQYDLDAGLITLSKSMSTNSLIMPACVDFSANMNPKDQELGVLAGWGITESGSRSSVLKWTFQKYIDYEKCRTVILPSDDKFLTHDKFCTGEFEGGKADRGDSGGGLTFVREETHYIYGIVSTKLFGDEKNVRLFTNLMNDGHRAWLLRQWRNQQVQHGHIECMSNDACSGNLVCRSGKCQDPCSFACGANSFCKISNHLVTCACRPAFTGDPTEGCHLIAGSGECSENEDCAADKACMRGKCANPCTNACTDDYVCEVKAHIPTCSQRRKVQKLHTRNENYRYTFLPSGGSAVLKFKVKARNDAHIMLSETPNPTGSQPYYEIVIGGWGNSKSVIRRDRNLGERAEAQTNQFLSEQDFRGFWIKTSGGTIGVGKENEETPFMSWTDPSPLAVKYVGFATGFGTTGDWIAYGTKLAILNMEDECLGAGCEDNEECSEDKACVSGACVNPCAGACRPDYFCEVNAHIASCSQPGNVLKLNTPNVNYKYTYLPAPQNAVIKFKVKAANDVHVLLTDNPTGSEPYREIVIGGWGNSRSIIRSERSDQQGLVSADTSGVVSTSEFRGFWVRYTDGKVTAGRENEVSPFLDWSDPNPFILSYFGIATGFGSTGEWIIFGSGCLRNEECPNGEACVSGSCENPCINACDEDLYCEAKRHTPVCFYPGKVKRVNTLDANFQYTFFPAPSKPLIRFKVKARNDVHIMLAELENPSGSQPYYEMVFGGWGNSKSVIRRDRDLGERAEAATPNLLSNNEFRGYWVVYDNGRIAVGRENEKKPIMMWTDPSPLNIRYFGVNTGFGSTGQWILYGSSECSSNEDCAASEVCVSDSCVNSCNNVCEETLFCEAKRHTPVCFHPGKVKKVNTQDADFQYTFFPAPSGYLVRFKVKARNDAHFMLSEYKNPKGSQPYYEIVFGGWGNSKSVIRRDRTLGERAEATASGFLSDSEFRGFWINFKNGNITVGRENEIKPFMAWTDRSPLKIKYFGVNTGFGSTGQWILYGSGCSVDEECPNGKACVSGSCANPCDNACDEDLFCEAKTHDPVCFHPGQVKRVNTPDANFQYTFFPASSGPLVRFKVKARNDAHFMLSAHKNPTGSQPYYEIVLGGWSNTKSTIRRDRNKGERAQAVSRDFLNNNKFRGFWINFENGILAVGRENEKKPFMVWTDPSPLKIKYFGVNTGFGSTGQWILYER